VCVDALIVVVCSVAPVLAELARGRVHAGLDLGRFNIPLGGWWWSEPRWLGGWNPWILAGHPANGDPQINSLHPLDLLYAVLSGQSVTAIQESSIPALAGLGMLAYLRVIGCGRIARIVGALCFALGGFVGSRDPHLALMRAAMPVPWALVALESLSGARLASALAVCTGLIAVAGHPQGSVYALLLVMLHAVCLGRALLPGRRLPTAAGLAIGVCLAAPMWLPALTLAAESTRASGVSWALPGFDPVLLWVPFALEGGTGPLSARTQTSIPTVVIEFGAYPGMVCWLLLLCAAPALVRDRRARIWLAIGLVGLVGASAGPRSWILLGMLRGPSRFLLWWSTAAAVLAGIAADAVLGAITPALRRRALGSAAVLLVVVVAIVLVRPQSAPSATVSAAVLVLAALPWLLPAQCSGAVGPALTTLLVADLFAFNFTLPPSTLTAEASRRLSESVDGVAAQVSPPGRMLFARMPFEINWATASRSAAVQGYSPLVRNVLPRLLRQGDLETEVGVISNQDLVMPQNHVLDLLRVSVLAFPALGEAPDPRDLLRGLRPDLLRSLASHPGDRWVPLQATASSDPLLFRNLRALPVAWLVDRIRVVTPEEAWATIHGDSMTPDFDPLREALVPRPLAELSERPAGRLRDPLPPVEVLHYGEDEIRLRAGGPRPTLLVTSELAYPGWRARIEGRPVPIQTVNGAFRALVLRSGDREVVLSYRPLENRVGLALGAIALLALIVALVLAGAPLPGPCDEAGQSRVRLI
jgi:hypothetical protein